MEKVRSKATTKTQGYCREEKQQQGNKQHKVIAVEKKAARKQKAQRDCRGEKQQQGNKKHKVIAVEKDSSKETKSTR